MPFDSWCDVRCGRMAAVVAFFVFRRKSQSMQVLLMHVALLMARLADSSRDSRPQSAAPFPVKLIPVTSTTFKETSYEMDGI